ncbi:MAG: hypothetical protein K0S34_1241 [Bacillales bacterium]|jgi:iron complex transport system substrate-binding protein|nr:hypothetical protein [Bacillales bacterium]
MNYEKLDMIERMNFSIIEVYNDEFPSDYEASPNNKTMGYGFLYILNGSGIFTFADKELVLKKGQIIHGNRDTSLKIKITSDEPLEYFLILYSCSLSYYDNQERFSIGVQSPFHFEGAIEIENKAELVGILQYLSENWKNKYGVEKIRLKGQFYEFLYLVLKSIENKNKRNDLQINVQSTIDYMKHNYMEPLNLDLFAEKTGWSTGYFCNVFKNKVGISPIEFLIDIRMERAKVLLERSNSSLKDIAKSVGYEDPYYFSRIFKKKIGCSPSQFKKSVCENNPSDA